MVWQLYSWVYTTPQNAHANAPRSWFKNITSSITCNNLKLEITSTHRSRMVGESYSKMLHSNTNEWMVVMENHMEESLKLTVSKRRKTQSPYSTIPYRLSLKASTLWRVKNQGIRSPREGREMMRAWGSFWGAGVLFLTCRTCRGLHVCVHLAMIHPLYAFMFCVFVWMGVVLHIKKLKTFNELKKKGNLKGRSLGCPGFNHKLTDFAQLLNYCSSF